MYYSQPRSQISRHYAGSLGLKISAAVTTLFVTISVAASIRGSGDCTLFAHEPFPVAITENNFADIVLGDDWLEICRAAARDGSVVFAPYTYEAQFNIPSDVLPSLHNGTVPETLSQTPRGEPALQDESEALSPAPQGEPALQVEYEPSAMQAKYLNESPAMQVEYLNKLSVHQTESMNKLSAPQAEIMTGHFLPPTVSVNTTSKLNIEPRSSLRPDHHDIESLNVETNSYSSLSLEEKRLVLQFLVVTRKASVKVLQQYGPRHQHMSLRIDGKLKTAAVLRKDFESHQCTNACLVLQSEAIQAGIIGKPTLSPVEYQECALLLQFGSGRKKRKPVSQPERPPKQRRTSMECSNPGSVPFPYILPQSEKDQIIHEFRGSTSNKALKRYECSFCGKLELAIDVKMRNVKELDISVLNHAVDSLRKSSRQPRIEAFK
ncbi:hypothetical protein R3P38DRAFT_2758182 [Favolaschia claudopus]|uniref:Uncharacterized protein n=1 Tax=Favolaschia claudopus TaxID=2862362 RepID=A0AAW0EBV3_9AGAR